MKRTIPVAGLLAALAIMPAALARGDDNRPRPSRGETLAVIADTPYGAEQIARFAQDVEEINADPDVRRVVHLGDIKDGSSRCDDAYLQARLEDFERFADPFVYTPGDNEWTDCHRASNGGYLPTERLDAVRRTFFPRPGRTLGERARVEFQSRRYPENTRWTQAGVTFGVVHVVGSNDDQAPWFGDRRDAAGAPTPETPAERALRSREYIAREAAAAEWIDAIFDAAQRQDAPGVVLGMQADMYDASAPPSALSAFAAIKAVIADRAARFAKPVLLLEGDSHELKVDRPADQPANLTRVVVQGSTNTPHEWLRLRVDPGSSRVFSCENVEFATRRVTPCPAPPAP